jgi:hypothetical protein
MARPKSGLVLTQNVTVQVFSKNDAVYSPDSNQKALAGECYVASLLSRMGYGVSLTIGNAKAIDVTASSESPKTMHFQVKTTGTGYDWLVPGPSRMRNDLLVVFVRLGADPTRKPELYVLTSGEANSILDRRYDEDHSPRVPRAKVTGIRGDHDLSPILARLGST